jgi:NAD+ diphosphatase
MSASFRSRANTFAALALDRLSERRDDVDWLTERGDDPSARFFLLRSDGRALVQDDESALFALELNQRRQWLAERAPSFLGSSEGAPWFLLTVESDLADTIAASVGARYLDLRSAGLRLPAFDAGLFAFARALQYWQTRTRFCGICGAATVLLSGGHKAACSNPACAAEHFPRTDPAIIVIVSHRDACLLGRQPSWPERRYSTLAGFVEPGETLEDAVRREVFEEAGVEVIDCDYHSSQPWPFPASIMLGFTAKAADRRVQVGAELAEARWFEVDELVDGLKKRELVLPPPLSVSYRLIEHWLQATAGLDLAALMHDEPWLARR